MRDFASEIGVILVAVLAIPLVFAALPLLLLYLAGCDILGRKPHPWVDQWL